ncbi:Hypp956 [Branchiostoma lanceolatum]|uniref:Hypp956 protein n=1 Tax=Branchiostoma lanceolatum TaxID=7740 RepID=A0A8J9ZFL2_BRALA|nr:Hypp956 [Branchiostoma lanceolatum]
MPWASGLSYRSSPRRHGDRAVKSRGAHTLVKAYLVTGVPGRYWADATCRLAAGGCGDLWCIVWETLIQAGRPYGTPSVMSANWRDNGGQEAGLTLPTRPRPPGSQAAIVRGGAARGVGDRDLSALTGHTGRMGLQPARDA